MSKFTKSSLTDERIRGKRTFAEVFNDAIDVFGIEQGSTVAVTAGQPFLPAKEVNWSMAEDNGTLACAQGQHWYYFFQRHKGRYDHYKFYKVACDCAPPGGERKVTLQ
jgi:hypothetical protein